MALRVCDKCGEGNSTSARVCVVCGASLMSARIEGKENYTPVQKGLICDKCGEKLKPGVRNCPNCGHFISKGLPEPEKKYLYQSTQSSNYSEGSSNTFLYCASFLIPFIGFIAGAVMLTTDDPYKKSAGSTCIVLGVVSVIVCAIIVSIL